MSAYDFDDSVDSDNYPHCPHCKKVIQDWADGNRLIDGDEHPAQECPHCEKLFTCRVYVSVSFTTEKEEKEV